MIYSAHTGTKANARPTDIKLSPLFWVEDLPDLKPQIDDLLLDFCL